MKKLIVMQRRLQNLVGAEKSKGTCNIFVAVAPALSKRLVKLTDTRKKEDFVSLRKSL